MAYATVHEQDSFVNLAKSLTKRIEISAIMMDECECDKVHPLDFGKFVFHKNQTLKT